MAAAPFVRPRQAERRGCGSRGAGARPRAGARRWAGQPPPPAVGGGRRGEELPALGRGRAEERGRAAGGAACPRPAAGRGAAPPSLGLGGASAEKTKVAAGTRLSAGESAPVSNPALPAQKGL